MQTPSYQGIQTEISSSVPSPFILSRNAYYPEVEQAFSQILNELYKKDNRISELEKEVSVLKNQLNALTKNTNINYRNNHIHNYNNENIFHINNTHSHFDDIPLQSEVLSGYKSPSSQSSSNRGAAVHKQKSIYSINNSFLTSNNNKSINNASSSMKDNSQWKSDVKKYLNEVKDKVEPQLFHEFITYIKIMTGKSNSSTNKKEIIDKVKELFGTQHYDLFQKFEMIVCLKRNVI